MGETERLYGVLDHRLEGRDYVVGPGRGKYSIADIALIGWANMARFAGINLDQFPNVKTWSERVIARPAVARGLAIPSARAVPFSNAGLAKAAEEDPVAKEKEEAVWRSLEEAKAKYNYKYTSP